MLLVLLLNIKETQAPSRITIDLQINDSISMLCNMDTRKYAKKMLKTKDLVSGIKS